MVGVRPGLNQSLFLAGALNVVVEMGAVADVHISDAHSDQVPGIALLLVQSFVAYGRGLEVNCILRQLKLDEQRPSLADQVMSLKVYGWDDDRQPAIADVARVTRQFGRRTTIHFPGFLNQ